MSWNKYNEYDLITSLFLKLKLVISPCKENIIHTNDSLIIDILQYGFGILKNSTPD